MFEANDNLTLAPNARMHVVLIPGFAGFDALGQLEYYAGVTPLFRRWQQESEGRATAVLHYFDNFPTASVMTRAGRLASYLAKRIARGEISHNDRIALVGHSTGGLDIRRLLWDLAHSSKLIRVDGGKGTAVKVPAAEILEMVQRIVFLSVPQWGTNIADWVRAHSVERRLVVAQLRGSVAASQAPLIDTLERLVASRAASFAKTDLVYALQDSLCEIEADRPRDEMGTALAQEAASLLELWLRHIASDFSVIDDLASWSPKGDDKSPAHFTVENRKHEQRIWKDIKVRSYATRSPSPFSFDGVVVPTWDLLKPWTYPDCYEDKERSARTDIVYRMCYRACAGGPFQLPPSGQLATNLLSGAEQKISVWENDGIVNTASMLWPNGKDTLLVDGDHMDIVGHREKVDATAGSDRRFHAYNLLKSGSNLELKRAIFKKVWTGVFEFCIPFRVEKSVIASAVA